MITKTLLEPTPQDADRIFYMRRPSPPSPKDPNRSEPRLTRRIGRSLRSPGTAVAIVALIISLTGSASAALVVSGLNIKNGTLTGADLKLRTLVAADFSATALKSMRGAKGPIGTPGQVGIKGATGAVGPQGAQGNSAHVASKFAWWESRYLTTSGSNSGSANWHEYATANPSAAAPEGNTNQLNKQFANPVNRAYENVMDLNSPGCAPSLQGISCPFGSNDGGGVTVSWNSNLTAMAQLNVMYTQEADVAGGDVPPHVRINCYLAANNGSSSTEYAQIGAKSSFSGFRQRQVETVTLVGSINRTASSPQTYLVRVMCRDADGTATRNRFWIVGGSLSVVATERG